MPTCITTNDDTVCGDAEPSRDRSPLASERLPENRDDPGRPRQDSTRLVPRGSQARRPEGRLLRREERGLLRLGRPRWVDELTEFTLTVLKLSSLIKETQTLINPGSVKFSPGDRGG